MNPAICWGNRIIPKTTTNAAQSSTLPSNLPRTAHCLARCCCQNPRPSNATERPKSQGRSVVKKALAAPAPRAAANPSGRQQLIVATELSIATNEADTPVPCFMACPLAALPAPLGESLPQAEGRLVSIRDTDDNSAQKSALLGTLRLPWASFSQNRAMSRSFAHLSVATAQGQTQLVLQLVKVSKFPLYVRELFFQSAPHRRTRLQAASPQIQETANLAEFESQALYTADKSQRLDVVFAVSPEASLCPRRPRKQTVALVKANRVNAEPNLLCDDANLHYLGSPVQATPWSIVQSQALLSGCGAQAIGDALAKAAVTTTGTTVSGCTLGVGPGSPRSS